VGSGAPIDDAWKCKTNASTEYKANFSSVMEHVSWLLHWLSYQTHSVI